MVDTKVCTKCGEEKSLSEYYKGKAYKHGITPQCKKCRSKYNKKYRQENRDAILKLQKKYRQKNREALLERKKKYYQGNSEAIKGQKKKYRQENKEAIKEYNKKYYQENRKSLLEHMKVRSKKHYQENKGQYRRRRREREGILKQQTPNWLTPIDNIVMNHIYATCPEGYHVDHIVPLKSDKVSGLNVPWNLQHLPAEENIAKGNRYWPDMWEYDDG